MANDQTANERARGTMLAEIPRDASFDLCGNKRPRFLLLPMGASARLFRMTRPGDQRERLARSSSPSHCLCFPVGSKR